MKQKQNIKQKWKFEPCFRRFEHLIQVKAVPILSAEESLGFFDQVHGALNDYLTNLNIEVLE